MITTIVMPTLGYGTTQVLKTPPAITEGVIKFFFLNPGEISETFPNLISFRVTEARHETDPAGLISAITHQLESTLQSLLPDLLPTVTISRTDNGPTKYTLTIKIVDSVGQALLYGQHIVVSNNGGIDFNELMEDDV